MSALLEIEQLEVSFGGRTSAVRGASLASNAAKPTAWWASPVAASR